MAIQRIKLPDGRELAIDEWLHWPMYSTVQGEGGIDADLDPLNLGNGAKVALRLFSYVVGANIPQTGGLPRRSATDSDTNQVARSKLNHDEAFLAFSMTYEISALDDDTTIPGLSNSRGAVAPIFTGGNLKRMQRDCLYELFVGAGISKPQARAPLSYYGQGIGSPAWGSGDVLNTGAGQIALSYGTAGYVSPLNQRRWQLPIYIGPDQVMYAKLYSPNGSIQGLSQDWQFKGYLDGLKRRAVA